MKYSNHEIVSYPNTNKNKSLYYERPCRENAIFLCNNVLDYYFSIIYNEHM